MNPKTLQRTIRVAPRLTSPPEGIGGCADSAMRQFFVDTRRWNADFRISIGGCAEFSCLGYQPCWLTLEYIGKRDLQSLVSGFWACGCIVMGLRWRMLKWAACMILSVSAMVFGYMYVFLHVSHRRAEGGTLSQLLSQLLSQRCSE